jgi:hypothetical protein
LPEHLDRGTGVGPGDLGIVGEGGVDDDLQALEAGAVVELDEREGLGIAAGADPALEEDGVGGAVALRASLTRVRDMGEQK